MTPLIVVLGIVGAILILVGLVGGNFTISGKFMPQVGMPKIGNWVRLPCFSVGAILVVVAVSLGIAYSPFQASADTSNQIATGTVMAPQGALYVFQQPSLSSPHVAEIANYTTISILCTAEGDVVRNPHTSTSSSLWDSTSEGFVPDVYVNTGTNQPTMSSC
jgi:hypothetical protein